MQSTTIAVDTAKLVFEVVVSDGHRVIGNHRLNRADFQAFIVHQPPSRFVMEACGGSHHWARLMLAHGHSVRLLPVPYVRAYRPPHKTHRADRLALVLGAEGKGVRPGVKAACDQVVRLDVPGPIKSLNVSNACVLALYAGSRLLDTR